MSITPSISTSTTTSSPSSVASTDTSRSTTDQASSTIGATSSTQSKTGATTGATTSSTDIAAATTGADITTRMTEWRLGDAELQADLDRGVAIVRTKDSLVGAPTGNTDDAVIETMVKGKLQADAETSKAMLDVKAHNGEVSLSGSADSAHLVGRAIALSLDTQGVSKVTSDVKVAGKGKN